MVTGLTVRHGSVSNSSLPPRKGQSFSGVAQLAYKCKADQAAAAARHYQANKADYLKRAKAANSALKVLIRSTISLYLESHPCIACGESDPIVLEFDHRVHADKKFSIGDAAKKTISIKRLMSEIAKCDVLCANCHRRKTYHERGLTHKD